MDRPNRLKSVALAAAGAGPIAGSGAVSAGTGSKRTLREKGMPFISAEDGTSLFYKDWGSGKPVVFVSSWGLNSDMWQYQMTPMVNQGSDALPTTAVVTVARLNQLTVTITTRWLAILLR
jgi:non-heme chloroperoxidase